MQQRQEIVGYRSSFNQILAHLQTGIPVAIISMQTCRLVLGNLSDPSFDNIFRAFGFTAAFLLIKHMKDNFGAENLTTLQNDVRDSLVAFRERAPRLPNLCLFSSVAGVNRRHIDTIIGSALAGAVLLKSFELFLNTGISISNVPVFAATFSLLILLFSDFACAVEDNFDAINVTSDGVLAM